MCYACRWFLLVLCSLAPDGAASGADDRPDRPALDRLVHEFFQTNDARARSDLIQSIADAAGNDIGVVATAVRAVQVWETVASGHSRFATGPDDASLQIASRTPDAYDPANAYPVVLCLRPTGMSAKDVFRLAVATLGRAVEDWILVAPEADLPTRFHRSDELTETIEATLRATRRRFHTDTDRVFLFGFGDGGDAAWMAAMMGPDRFAGVIVSRGYPHLPYPEQVYPFLLENLRAVGVVTVWPAPPPDNPVDATAPRAILSARHDVVAAHNQAIADRAQAARLAIAGFEIASTDDRAGPMEQAVARLLERRRPSQTRRIAHWFRYPRQGQTGWLALGRLSGEPWRADQLSIAAAPTTDFSSFVVDTIQSKLAYLGGFIDGQNITIEVRGCDRVDLTLGPDSIDYGRPVTITCNGRRRRPRSLTPKIATLLEQAQGEWEFQRLVACRVPLSVKTDANLKATRRTP